jgi:hypothetical protein
VYGRSELVVFIQLLYIYNYCQVNNRGVTPITRGVIRATRGAAAYLYALSDGRRGVGGSRSRAAAYGSLMSVADDGAGDPGDCS